MKSGSVCSARPGCNIEGKKTIIIIKAHKTRMLYFNFIFKNTAAAGTSRVFMFNQGAKWFQLSSGKTLLKKAPYPDFH